MIGAALDSMGDCRGLLQVRCCGGDILSLPSRLVSRIPLFKSALGFKDAAELPRTINAAALGISKCMIILAAHKIKPLLTAQEEHDICDSLGLLCLDNIPGPLQQSSTGTFGQNADSLEVQTAGISTADHDSGKASDYSGPAHAERQWRSLYDLLDFMGLDGGSSAFRDLYFDPEYSSSELVQLHHADGSAVVQPCLHRVSDQQRDPFFPGDVIVLAPPWHVRAVKQMATQDTALQRLDSNALRVLVDANKNLQGAKWILAGGSVCNALCGCSKAASDYDMFLVLDDGENNCCEQVERAVCELHSAISSLDASLYCIQRSAYAITFYLNMQHEDDSDADMVPIQAIGWYASISAILNSFDIACCQVAYDGDRFLASRKGRASLGTACNVVNLHDISPQYVYRLGKYLHRGISIAVPTSCQAKFVDPDPAWKHYRDYIESSRGGPRRSGDWGSNTRKLKHAEYMKKTTILERLVNMARAASFDKLSARGLTLRAHDYEIVGNKYLDAVGVSSGDFPLSTIRAHIAHLEVLQDLYREASFYLAEDLELVLRPVGTSYRFPTGELANSIPPRVLYIPQALRCPFAMPNRTGVGSFQKLDLERVVSDGQWHIKLGVEHDDTLRDVLGLPELQQGWHRSQGLPQVVQRQRLH